MGQFVSYELRRAFETIYAHWFLHYKHVKV
jgi:hypothetical protein